MNDKNSISQNGEKNKQQTYPVTYKVDYRDPPWTKRQVERDGLGGCDSLIVISQIYPDDGGYSQLMATLDGRTGEPVDNNEVWKAWAMMAADLMEREDLPSWKSELCRIVHMVVKKQILKCVEENQNQQNKEKKNDDTEGKNHD